MSLLSECVAVTYVAATLGCLGWAAWSDLAVRLIPNTACLAIALLGALYRLSIGLEVLLVSVGVGLCAFILLVLLHARGMMGGGDVKLIAATVLGYSPAGALRFIVVTAMMGGVLAFLHLVLRGRLAPQRAQIMARRKCPGAAGWLVQRVLAAEIWRIRKRGSLPYGVAIAGGGAWIVLTGSGG